MNGLVELPVLVSTPPGTQPERRRLVAAIEQFNATATWRYLTRYTVRRDEPGGGRYPASGVTAEVGDAAADAARSGVVVALVRGEHPPALAQIGRADIERWQAAGPWLVVIEDLHPAPAPDGRTLQRRDRLHALIDWAETQPRVLVAHRSPGDDIGAVVTHLMADVARRGWMERNGVDRLVCRRCGHQTPFERSVGLCPHDGSVMVQPAIFGKRRVPSWIGDFPIHGVVGRGAFGKVWLSMNSQRQWGALKTLVDTENAHALARLNRELRLLAQFEHRHIVRLLERSEIDGAPVGLLEYLPGRPLKFVIDALPPRHVLDLTLELLSALMVIHQQGIVHRDLKPGNIMLVDDPLRPADPPRLVLLDFGLGKHETHFQEQLTKQGMVLGTPNYMAPEQFLSAADVDGRADIYAVGVMLYMALTPDKRYPIPPPKSMNDVVALLDFIRRVQTTDPEPIDRPDLPQGIRQLVMKALARRPEDRFATSAQFHQALVRELERWDDVTIDETDHSWMNWAPSAAYVAYHAQARGSGSSDVTVSSESLPETLTSSPGMLVPSAEPSASAFPPPPPTIPRLAIHGRSGNTAVLDRGSVRRAVAEGPPPIPPRRDAPQRRTVVDPSPPRVTSIRGPAVTSEPAPETSVDPAIGASPAAGPAPAASAATVGTRRPAGGRRLFAALVIVALIFAAGGVVYWSLRPVPVFADVVVHGEDGSPVGGVEVVVDGRPIGVATDADGHADVPLGMSDGGPWLLEVVAPANLRVRGSGRRQVERAALDARQRARAAFEMYNPFVIRNPGGSLVPVGLAADHVVLLRRLRLGRIVPADRGGLIDLPKGTELHACQGRRFVQPGSQPEPQALLGALEACMSAADDSGLTALTVRYPGQADVESVLGRVAP